ncbi:MAG: Rho termination factor N-terminal domain-containing protein [Nitrospirota bacterium]|nr:Rho termination factor N-terminal domain-containing protein [Nitrospirota bacterium]
MNLNDIKKIAKQMGIKAGKLKKDEVIRSIQRAEGNFDCFGTAMSCECLQAECLWREDCLSAR